MTTDTHELMLPARTLEPGAGEKIWIAGDTMWLKATATDTGGAYTMIEVLAAPGGGPPPHYHDNEDETFLVLDGTFEILIGDRTFRAAKGAYALVPRGTVHRFRNVGDRHGRIIVMFTPGGLEGFFREAGQPALNDGQAPPVDKAEIARTSVAGEKFGLHVVTWDARNLPVTNGRGDSSFET